ETYRCVPRSSYGLLLRRWWRVKLVNDPGARGTDPEPLIFFPGVFMVQGHAAIAIIVWFPGFLVVPLFLRFHGRAILFSLRSLWGSLWYCTTRSGHIVCPIWATRLPILGTSMCQGCVVNRVPCRMVKAEFVIVAGFE